MITTFLGEEREVKGLAEYNYLLTELEAQGPEGAEKAEKHRSYSLVRKEVSLRGGIAPPLFFQAPCKVWLAVQPSADPNMQNWYRGRLYNYSKIHPNMDLRYVEVKFLDQGVAKVDQIPTFFANRDIDSGTQVINRLSFGLEISQNVFS